MGHADAMAQAALRVLVVDDHPVVRRGTARILEEAGIQVAGEAATAEQALELTGHAAPDVVLADVRLPGMSGIELVTELRRRRPGTRVLILSSYGDPGYVRAALEAGAAGYMLKTASDEELISAVRSAALGATIVDAAVSADLFSAAARSPQALTDREREILALVTRGLPNKAIAHSLTVSKRTVDAHLAHLFTKLGVSSRAELVAWAARHGMIGQ
jgi:DNA-binding NarL/FixJ family response regulator